VTKPTTTVRRRNTGCDLRRGSDDIHDAINTPCRRDGAASRATLCSEVNWRRERFESNTGLLAAVCVQGTVR
jgi:hypothetical protein